MGNRAATIALCLMLLAGCGNDPNDSEQDSADGDTCSYPAAGVAAKEATPPAAEPTATGTVPVLIKTSAGNLNARLDAEGHPCTVNSFLSLAEQAYFDGTPCHRLTTAGIFVLQCGDPTGTGTGGPGYSFPDELTGTETYPAGTLAMANAGANTNGSQFFLVYKDTKLDAKYTVFGKVDASSIRILQRIAAKGSDETNGPGDGAPLQPVTMTSVTVR